MSGATSRADFVYFIKSASPALPNVDEAYFISNRRTRYSSLVSLDVLKPCPGLLKTCLDLLKTCLDLLKTCLDL